MGSSAKNRANSVVKTTVGSVPIRTHRSGHVLRKKKPGRVTAPAPFSENENDL